ncbi:MAG: hypothetical protein QOD80_414 [Verrucomicrobiota bacterium]|jgi:hypothetical protein
MKVPIPSTLVLVVACTIGVASADKPNEPNASSENARHIRDKAEALMRDWKTVPVNVLRDPANTEAIQQLRTEAKAAHRDDARVPLLRMSDPETTTQCITEFRTEKSARRNAARQLGLSGNPAIIPLVAEDLFRDEKTEAEWITPELRERPLSVHAADIIRAIIGASSEFNSATKTWALSLPRATNQRDAVRSEMRRWWLENRDAVGAGRYQQVGPPRK